MKIILTLLSILFLNTYCWSQVTIETNLLPSIAPNSTLNVEVKIVKGSISNFSKYQMDVPAGVSVMEGNSRTGNFTFDAARAKIVWVSIPQENEFIISFIMHTGTVSGTNVFNQKFFYLENGTKKEVEADPFTVNFEASGATALKSITPISDVAAVNTNTVISNPKPEETQTVTVNTNISTSTNTLSEVAVNVNTTSVETNTIPTEKTVTEITNTMTANATETEKAITETTVTPVKTEAQKEPVAEVKTEPVTKTPPVETKPEITSTAAEAFVYRIQIGAFGVMPDKSKFKNAGKVEFKNEDGLYKALTGNYSSKEDALKRHSELKALGIDGFVVKYLNGQRVK